MGHRSELLEAWESVKRALLGPSSTLSPQLKEEVPRTLPPAARRLLFRGRSGYPPTITKLAANRWRSR